MIFAKEWDTECSERAAGLGIQNCHDFQLLNAIKSGPPILNVAGSCDPAGLGKHGSINMDVRTTDQLRRDGLTVPENYVNGSVFSIPFDNFKFKTVVLGEFLEHCTEDAATRAVKECARVLCHDGNLVITVPLDGRPNGHNRPGFPEGAGDFAPYHEWSPGVTSHHQTWWSNEMLWNLRNGCGLVEVGRTVLFYGFVAPVTGWGIVWRKPVVAETWKDEEK